MFTWPRHAAPYISGQGVPGASNAAGTDTGASRPHGVGGQHADRVGKPVLAYGLLRCTTGAPIQLISPARIEAATAAVRSGTRSFRNTLSK